MVAKESAVAYEFDAFIEFDVLDIVNSGICLREYFLEGGREFRVGEGYTVLECSLANSHESFRESYVFQFAYLIECLSVNRFEGCREKNGKIEIYLVIEAVECSLTYICVAFWDYDGLNFRLFFVFCK